MKQQSIFILAMYWLLRVAFWFHLAVTCFIISLDSFDWLGWLHDEPLTYTVRGDFGMYPNQFKPDTTLHQLTTPNNPDIISLVHHSGWARLDYTNFEQAFAFNNIFVTLLDICIWLSWLSITYLLYKMLESCKNQNVFDMITVKRIRLLALAVGGIALLGYMKNRVFADIIYSHISYEKFQIVMRKVDVMTSLLYSLLILVIAEVIKYGISLKQENDLTI